MGAIAEQQKAIMYLTGEKVLVHERVPKLDIQKGSLTS
jgi:hypothetical protein